MPASKVLTEKEIAQRLAIAHRQQDGTPPEADSPFPSELYGAPPRPAAVLIPLLRVAEDWHVLFTRRDRKSVV